MGDYGKLDISAYAPRRFPKPASTWYNSSHRLNVLGSFGVMPNPQPL